MVAVVKRMPHSPLSEGLEMIELLLFGDREGLAAQGMLAVVSAAIIGKTATVLLLALFSRVGLAGVAGRSLFQLA